MKYTVQIPSGGYEGLLSGQIYKTAQEAEQHEGPLFQLAMKLLGREPTWRELNRQKADIQRPIVPRKDQPQEARYARIKTTQPDRELTEEEAIKVQLNHARQKLRDKELEKLSLRERMLHSFIERDEKQLAALNAKRDRQARMAELQESDDYQERFAKLHTYRVMAGFSSMSPEYESDVVDAMSDALSEFNFDRFDELELPFRSRMLARAAEQRRAISESVSPIIDSTDAVDALLSGDDEVAE